MDMGVSYTVLNDIVRGKRSVNTKFALLCEKALNIPAYLLLRLQADYDMLVTKRDKSFAERLAKVRKIAAVLHKTIKKVTSLSICRIHQFYRPIQRTS